ncbi:MAG: MFS transporter [Candidatus Gracilibacteria bacterium]|nr:MFS transporter [Candidatus Gracilibacteria bacterium]
MKANIWKLYILRFLTWFMVMIPVFILFLQKNGLSFQEIFILQAFFSFWIVVWEIPSGYLSDKWSRKNTIVLGTVFMSIGYMIYTQSYGFGWFLFAEFFVALGASCISGSDSALLYDSLQQINKGEDYRKIEAKSHSISSFSEGMASLCSSIVVMISLRATVYAQAAVIALSIPIALSLVEPTSHKASSAETGWKDIMNIVKHSLHDQKEIKWLILYGSLIGASTFSMVWFIQPSLEQANIPVAWFGIIWALLQFSISIFALLSDKYEKTLGRKWSLISLLTIVCGSYFLLGVSGGILGLFFFFPYYFVRGVKEPIFKDYINKLVPSEMRSTVLSVKSMMMRIIFVILGPIIGMMTDIYDFQTAYLFAGIAFGTLGVVCLIGLERNKAL